jgi:parallel beta-helix repeat protein
MTKKCSHRSSKKDKFLIGQCDLPYKIRCPGEYFVRKNLKWDDGNAIIVGSNNVSITFIDGKITLNNTKTPILYKSLVGTIDAPIGSTPTSITLLFDIDNQINGNILDFIIDWNNNSDLDFDVYDPNGVLIGSAASLDKPEFLNDVLLTKFGTWKVIIYNFGPIAADYNFSINIVESTTAIYADGIQNLTINNPNIIGISDNTIGINVNSSNTLTINNYKSKNLFNSQFINATSNITFNKNTIDNDLFKQSVLYYDCKNVTHQNQKSKNARFSVEISVNGNISYNDFIIDKPDAFSGFYIRGTDTNYVDNFTINNNKLYCPESTITMRFFVYGGTQNLKALNNEIYLGSAPNAFGITHIFGLSNINSLVKDNNINLGGKLPAGSSYTGRGIDLAGGSLYQTRNCRFENNIVTNCNLGIYTFVTDSPINYDEVKYFVFKNNQVSNCIYGIYGDNAVGHLFEGNKASECRLGIFAQRSQNMSFINNSATGCVIGFADHFVSTSNLTPIRISTNSLFQNNISVSNNINYSFVSPTTISINNTSVNNIGPLPETDELEAVEKIEQKNIDEY